MRAVEAATFGDPDVLHLRELPDPTPRPGQALVATAASDVLFVDTLIRSGWGGGYFPIRPPYIPGNGVGGTVVAVGEGADRCLLGQRVIAHTGGPGGTGGYAELATADLVETVAVPDAVDLLDATAVLHDGVTALRVLEVCDVRAGEWVLVLGAAGGMGILLVQLLVARGAHVIGAARGWAKQAVVERAGAHAAVDYGEPGWVDGVLEATGRLRPTVVLDGVGGDLGGAALGLLADGGRFSAHGVSSGSFAPIDPDDARRRRIAVTTIADLQSTVADRTRLMKAAVEELQRERAIPLIGQTFSLAEAPKAHHAIAARETVAKTLLTAD
jgi:NADPH:quinone reductase